MAFSLSCRIVAACCIAALFVGCGAKGLNARLANGEARANKADDTLDDAEGHLRELAPDEAEAELKEVRELLAHPDVEYYPERELLKERLERNEAILPEVRKARAQRDLEARLSKQRQKLNAALEPYQAILTVVESKPDLDDDDADRAEDSLEALEDALDDGEKLETEDVAYRAEAADARALLTRTESKIKFAATIVKFREGPGKKSLEGNQAAKEAGQQSGDKDEQLESWQEARAAYARCEEEGKGLIAGAPALAAASVKVGDRVLPAKNLVASCEAERRRFDTKVKNEVARREAEEKRRKAAEERAEAKKRAAEAREEARKRAAELREESRERAADARKRAAEAKREAAAKKKSPKKK